MKSIKNYKQFINENTTVLDPLQELENSMLSAIKAYEDGGDECYKLGGNNDPYGVVSACFTEYREKHEPGLTSRLKELVKKWREIDQPLDKMSEELKNKLKDYKGLD